MGTSSEIEEFMQGPLVKWLKSCLDNPEKLQNYEDLADGCVIQQVFLQIDPDPMHQGVVPSLRNPNIRIQNMCCIIKNIKTLYQEELRQLIVALPDCVRLGREPESKEGIEDMKLLLLLLLGCAVQCPTKHSFIERIKSLEVDCQHALVHCIQQVTESQRIVLTEENCDNLTNEQMLSHIRKLIKEREYYFQMWVSTFEDKKTSSTIDLNISSSSAENQHLAVELADWKAKLRKLRQELEEKQEALVEAKEELERNNLVIAKFKSEIQEFKQEARIGKAYRDEVDALREKAERCERLEFEVVRYKEKLGDLEYYKSRVEELRQDKAVLEETREIMEEQLTKARKRTVQSLHLETELAQHKKMVEELSLERDANQEKIQDLLEENTQLRLLHKSSQSCDDSLTTVSSEDQIASSALGSSDNSLSDQLTTNAEGQILRLKLENERLICAVENLQESMFYRNNEHILQLEKEKKKLSLQVDELEDIKRKNSQHIQDLESTIKDVQMQHKRIQESHELLKEQLQRKQEDLENTNKEKLILEEKIENVSQQIEIMKQENDENKDVEKLQHKLEMIEKENGRIKLVTEEKNIMIDKLTTQNEALTKEVSIMTKQLEDANSQLTRIGILEKEIQDLISQQKIDRATLTALENDLVCEKVKTRKFTSLGLVIDNVTNDEEVLDKIVKNEEVLKAVRERISEEEKIELEKRTSLKEAKLQVNITTLQSQISSLTSQHTALQLANSQLVAEKEEAIKELNELRTSHEQLVNDQMALQSLHEQLTTEYEILLSEREILKSNVRELKLQQRTLKEQFTQLTQKYSESEAEREKCKIDSQSLVNLRAEHSKLKDDFRYLFTASERLKYERRTSEEDYRNVKSEATKLKAAVIDLQRELSISNDKIISMEVEISKSANRCELLSHMNTKLEDDRQSLMEHVSLLISQYHELLTHSLEDKEHYHMEEKMFADKVNNLHRQKEKLEEKIMEHYRKLESCPSKKKGFGATIVRKVKKAGSDLINKSRRPTHGELLDNNVSDSESSMDDNNSKQGVDMEDNLSCLSMPGTRRTVYLSGNDTVDGDDISSISTTGRDDMSKSPSSDCPRASTPHLDSRTPMVVYNRVSTKVANTTNTSHKNNKKNNNSPPPPPPPPEDNKNSVWYEYGCV